MAFHGTIVWNELLTTDAAAACAFYGRLFGWTFEAWPSDIGRYYLIHRPGGRHPIGGLFEWPAGEPGDGWQIYLGVDDIEAQVEAAEASGGRVGGIRDIAGVGRVAHVVDPLGYEFGMFQPVATWGADDYDPRPERSGAPAGRTGR